jgi:Zn-dependent M28 family amino/carboxypeptidase
MKIARYFLFVLSLFVWSCQKDLPLIENAADAIEVANSIEENKVFQWVEEIAEIHLNDRPIDNTGFPAEKLFPSDHLTRSAAVGFVAKAFEDMGYTTDTVVLGSEPQVAYNVVAEFKGTTRPNEVVLVAGHLDAFYGGADDNTTALAAMLEIARAIPNFQFERTIRFVAFDLEEFGSLGSTRYIEAGYANDVVSAVVMDLIGYSSDQPGSQKSVFGVKIPDVGNYLLVIGNQKSAEITQQVVNLSHTSGIAKTVGIIAPGNSNYFISSVFTRSDHGLMWYKGIPAIFFTDGANTRNPNYHLPTDLPETINENFLIANTKIIAATVAILAGVQP